MSNLTRLVEGNMALTEFDSAHQLLLICAGVAPDPARAARIREILDAPIDWEFLILAAHRHNIMPLVWRNLSRLTPDLVPEEVSKQFRKRYRANTHHNLLLTKELIHLLSVFESHGLTALPYKGPALASLLHGDLSLREFCDLDILVRPQDAFRASELLISQGYKPLVHLGDARHSSLLRGAYEIPFLKPELDIQVELQWRITPAWFIFPLEIAEIWNRLQTRELAGREVRGFAAEDLLLILCVHGTKHQWERIGWIHDVAQLLIVCPEIDWQQLFTRAGKLGSERMLALGCLLAHQLLAAPLSEKVVQRMQSDSGVLPLIDQVQHQLFSPPSAQGLLANALFHTRAKERLQDRLRYFVRLGITPAVGDLTLFSLPPLLAPLHLVLRPFRLAGKYGRKLIDRLR